MVREEFCRVVGAEVHRLYSLERNNRLPFDRSSGKKHERGDYTALAALLFTLFDEATGGADGLGINASQAAAWLRMATPMIEDKLPRILKTARAMKEGGEGIDEWLLLVAFLTGGRLIHCAPTSELFKVLAKADQPIVRFFGLNLSRAATVVLIRAEREKVELDFTVRSNRKGSVA